MHFAFTEEQESFRRSLRQLLFRACTPEAVRAAWTRESGRVPGLWAALAELGVLGLTVPAEHGGLALGELDLVLLLEEAGRAGLPEPLLETTCVGVPLLCAAGHAPRAAGLRSHFLPKVAAGEAVLAVGVSGAPYVAYAEQADLLLLADGDALHAVPPKAVAFLPQPSVDGSRRLCRVDWKPTKETLLCDGEVARQALAAAFERGALAAAAELLGIAQKLIEMTVAYVKVREQFGRPVGSFQAVKHHLASALLQAEFAAPTVYRAAHTVATGEPGRSAQCSVDVSLAKAYASEAAALAGRTALQCHGAIGYSYEYDLHLWLKRGWVLAAAWGDAAWHRSRIGRLLLDLDTEASSHGRGIHR